MEGWRQDWRVAEFRRVCGELLSKGRHWFVTGESGYLGWEILVVWHGVACLDVVTLTERLVDVWD